MFFCRECWGLACCSAWNEAVDALVDLPFDEVGEGGFIEGFSIFGEGGDHCCERSVQLHCILEVSGFGLGYSFIATIVVLRNFSISRNFGT